MASIGKIVSIKLETPSGEIKTMAHSLSLKGKSRVPNTGVMITPYRENNSTYRTGIDEHSKLIANIPDKSGREAEFERIKDIRERLQRNCNIADLTPTSKFWNYSMWTPLDQNHVTPEKLREGENIFNLENPFQELSFRWMSVHPIVAPSLEAYQRGDAGPAVQFYVYDEQVENERNYKKKKLINDAVIKLDAASPEKRKKVAKLMGLPVSDFSAESLVYNLIDSKLKETEFKEGQYRGLSTVSMFHKFMDMQGKLLNAKYLVAEAVDYNIFRKRESGI